MRCCCCLVDNSSGAVTRTREFGFDTISGRRGDGKGHYMAALMMRARPAVGLGEGKRMRVVLVLNLSKGRRYGVVGAAVCHGDKKINCTK